MTTEPMIPKQYYNYTRGLWRDSTHFKCGGTGYGGSINANYCYPGTSYSLSSCASNWSENTAPGDRRMIGSCGPLNFKADSMLELKLAYIWAQASTSSNIASINKLFLATDSIRNFYNSYLKYQNCPSTSIATKLYDFTKGASINIFPNPTTGLVTVETDETITKIEVFNELGKIIPLNSNSFTVIDFSSLQSGIYFMKLYTLKGVYNKKIVKI